MGDIKITNFSKYKNIILLDNRSNKFNFLNDGRIYYVYRITDINSLEYYYGSRILRKGTIEEDFWEYCTSSKRKSIINENKQNYKLKIIKTFNTSDDMMIYESYLHQYFDVKNHNKFFNEANQTPFGFNTNNIEPHNKGVTLSKEEALKRSSTRKEIIIVNGKETSSYKIAGAKISKSLSKTINGVSISTISARKSAVSMAKVVDGESIRTKAEQKRVNTFNNKKIIYKDKEMLVSEYNGIKVSEGLHKKTTFRGKEMLIKEKRNIITSEAKLIKGKFYNLYKDDSLIENGISEKLVKTLWNSLINWVDVPATNIRRNNFKIFTGCYIQQTNEINYNSLHNLDESIVNIKNKLSNLGGK